MAEVKLPVPVQATYDKRLEYGGRPSRRKASKPIVAGAFAINKDKVTGELGMWYACPCGCGNVGLLRIRATTPGAPETHPSWAWNGDPERPTLVPSVHHVGHWHGYLRDGMWVDA